MSAVSPFSRAAPDRDQGLSELRIESAFGLEPRERSDDLCERRRGDGMDRYLFHLLAEEPRKEAREQGTWRRRRLDRIGGLAEETIDRGIGHGMDTMEHPVDDRFVTEVLGSETEGRESLPRRTSFGLALGRSRLDALSHRSYLTAV